MVTTVDVPNGRSNGRVVVVSDPLKQTVQSTTGIGEEFGTATTGSETERLLEQIEHAPKTLSSRCVPMLLADGQAGRIHFFNDTEPGLFEAARYRRRGGAGEQFERGLH